MLDVYGGLKTFSGYSSNLVLLTLIIQLAADSSWGGSTPLPMIAPTACDRVAVCL